MGLADSFLSDAGAASQPAPASLASQFAADAAAPAASQPSANIKNLRDQFGYGSLLDSVKHQLGLTARAAVTGITAIPAVIGNAANTAVNYGIDAVNNAAGSHISHLAMPSQIIQNAETGIGLPEPQNAQERVVQDAASSMVGAGASIKAAQLASGLPGALAQSIGSALQSAPGNQLVAAASSGAAGGGAREAGLPAGAQIAASMLGGGIGALGSATAGGMAAKMANKVFPTPAAPQAATSAVEALQDSTPLPASPAQAANLQARTQTLMDSNPGASPVAAARAADFRALGMTGTTGPTLGQLTRDPGLWEREQNWARINGLGDPMRARLAAQNQQLANALRATAGSGGTEYQAGTQIMGSLKAIDQDLQSQVSAAYKAAQQSSGAQLNVPLQGVAQDYAQILNNFGDKVPSGVRNNFEALGLLKGTQNKTFDVNDAENLLKVINANKGNDPATNTALGQLATSVKNAVLSADDQGGAFAQARQLAAQRFALQEKIPALEAAAYSKVKPDDFARRFIINGNVDDIGGMAELLGSKDPQALKALQGQVGNKLQDAAFGVNVSGDRQFQPQQYAKAITRTLGPDMLAKVYSPDQLDDLFSIGRVGSLINDAPAISGVNRSGSGTMALDMAQNIPIVGKAINSLGNKALISRALRGNLQDTALPPPEVSPLVQALQRQR